MRMPTMRGEKDRCLKKGRVLKAVAAPARRAMKSMPGREGSWEENFILRGRRGLKCVWIVAQWSGMLLREASERRYCA